MRALSLTSHQDVLALIIRRKWWIVCTFLLALGVSAAVVYRVPNVYKSETLVFVKMRDMPQNMVQDLLGSEVEQRLAVIKEVIFSKTSLLRIEEEFKNELKFDPEADEDARAKALKDSIDMPFQSIRGGGTFFRVSYENHDPVLAQKVVNRLSSLLIEFDNKNRENRASENTDFLQTELDKVVEDLAKADEEARVTKEQNRFQLPEDLTGNIRSLELLQAQLKTNADALDRHAALRRSLQGQLEDTSPTVHIAAGAAPPVVNAPPPRTPSPVLAQYNLAAERYRALRDRYTERNPEVQTAKAQLERLEAELPADEAPAPVVVVAKPDTPARDVPNPVYENLKKQLQDVTSEIGIREREKHSIQSEINKTTGRIQTTPRIEEKILNTNRVRDDLVRRQIDLSGKVTAARMSESLGVKERDSEYSIIDKASLPTEPSKPNRMLLFLMCLVGSMTLAGGMAYGVDFLDQKIWTAGELEKLLGLPLLAEIPNITEQITATEEVAPEKLGSARATAVLGDVGASKAAETNEATIYDENNLIEQIRNIELENKTGVLTACRLTEVVRVYFRHGLIAGVASSVTQHHLTGYIKDEKGIDAKTLRQLLKESAKNRTPVGDVAVRLKILEPSELIGLIRRQTVDVFKMLLVKGFTHRSFEPSARHFAYPLQSKLDAVLLEVMRGQATPLVLGTNERVILREGKSLPWQPMELSVLGEVRAPRSFDELAAITRLGGEELARMLAVFRALGMIDILEVNQDITTALYRSSTTWLAQVAPQVDVSWYNDKLVTLYNQHSFINEQFRSLKVRLNNLKSTRPVQVVSVCSPYPGDGKSVISTNMALSLARDPQRRTIIVDCDLRRPTLHTLFGINASPGLIQYLHDDRLQPYSCIRRFGNLYFVTAGGVAENPVELLSMPRMKELLEFLRTGFDTVILDCPAMEPISDSQIVASMSDGVVMVVRCGKTPHRSLERVFRNIDRANVIGTIFNGAASMLFHSYDRAYYKPGKASRTSKQGKRVPQSYRGVSA